MNNRNQIILALALVLGASGATILSVRGRAGERAGPGAEGHDHAAMMAAANQARPVTLSPDAARRIGVTYAEVTRGVLRRTVSTVGILTYDETRVSVVAPKIDGWVERLHVDFTGAPIRAGEPLLDVYSPELVTAQEELLLARRLWREVEGRGEGRAAERALELLEAARRRLAYWDIPQEEIDATEERGTASRTLTLRAPAGGVVVEKRVVEGARIMPGMELFRVADLSRVWVEAEIFEKDLSLVGLGQHGRVTLEAYPGEIFHGMVTYVHPTVSSQTRTGRVRLELENPGSKLKPGMYAHVELQVSALQESLLVPRSAVLLTGERAVVFHRGGNGELHPREVTLGMAFGDMVEVVQGLSEGDVVASSANFLIDAESNLGLAMEAMAGMDDSGPDLGAMRPDTAAPVIDHSGHDMGGG